MLKTEDPPIGKLMSAIARSYVGLFTKQLEDLPLDRYFYPLVLIDEAEGPITQKELAERIMTDKVSVLRMVDHLSEKGMLVRRCNPDDGRSYHLELTDEGKALLPRIRKAIEDANRISLQGFTEEEVSDFENGLRRVMKNLTQEDIDDHRVVFSKVNDDEK